MAKSKINPTNELISGTRLARNSALNLLGLCSPLLVAIVAIPILIRGLGTDRFGVLTLVWVVIGYSSLFDLGLSRALTKIVAEKLGAGREQEIPALVWTAIFVMLLIGISGTLCMILFLPWAVRELLRIPQGLQAETLKAFFLIAFSVPVVVTSTGIRGVLEAYQRFDFTNAVRIPLGIYTFVAPILVLPFSHSLFPVVGILVVGRIFACIAHILLCFKVIPVLFRSIVFQPKMVKPLINFGGWMTVTNIIGPIMVYMDRFFIGALISVTAVAYYATPYEVVTKILFIPGALVGVLFPAFSASFVQDRSRAKLLFESGIKYVFLAIFPLTLITVTFANDGLSLWLGIEFAQNSTRVLQWLAVGVFINSLAQIPFALIQGAGRPDLTAKLHFIELPFYLGGLWYFIGGFGIEGAAIAWTIRTSIDAVLLFTVAKRILTTRIKTMRREILAMAVAIPPFVFAAVLKGFAIKGFFLLLVLFIYAFVGWFLILNIEERALIKHRFKIITT